MSSPQPGSLRALSLSVYLPTFLFAVGQGAVIPMVPLTAREMGGSLAFAGWVVALRGIGLLCFDVPAGWLVARLGERRAMAVGTALILVALSVAIAAPVPLLFAAAMFVMGCGWSVWLLARFSYVTDVLPPAMRGRALSTLGGVSRAGSFVGPFIGAALTPFGGLSSAYYIHIVSALVALASLWFMTRGENSGGEVAPEHDRIELFAFARQHAAILLSAGLGVIAISALRATRQGILPLWADQIQLDPSTVSVLFGISVGIEAALFYPAGSAMDRWGRKSVALPCIGLMSIGMLLVPLTVDFASLLLVAVVIGLGNGLGSGIVMTLGADFAPPESRARFLGVWRLLSDVGTAGGPLVIAALTGAFSLGVASVAMGVIGTLAALLLYVRMPESLQRHAG